MALTSAEVDTAIKQILSGGQSVTLDGVSVSRANLSQLEQMRARLQSEEARGTNGARPTFRAFNFNGVGY